MLDLINCWFFNNIKQWIINYFWKCCLRIQKKNGRFLIIFSIILCFLNILILIKKRENLLFLVNYKNTIFRKYLQLCKFIYYNIIYLKKEGKNEVCKDIDSVKFWSKNDGRERGEKNRKGREMLSVSSCFRFHRYKSWRMLERRSRHRYTDEISCKQKSHRVLCGL